MVIVVTGRFDIWAMSRRQGCGLAPCSLQVPPEALSPGLLRRLRLSLLRSTETAGVLSREETEGAGQALSEDMLCI